MRLERIALLCMLILLCLSGEEPAYCQNFSLAGAGGGSSFSASIALRAVGNSANLIETGAAGSFLTERSTGLLLLIGLALIGGASLIGTKIAPSSSADEAENTGETAIFSRPTWSPYEPPTPSITRVSKKANRGIAAMDSMQIQHFRRAPSNYGR